MEVLRRRCAGLDVHKDTVTACVRIADGRSVKREVREFATATRALYDLAAWLTQRGCSHAAMESTGVYWKPVWHVLEGHLELVLANATEVRNVPGRKSDTNDATWLADLLAHGLIRGSFVPPLHFYHRLPGAGVSCQLGDRGTMIGKGVEGDATPIVGRPVRPPVRSSE